jgi:hypothetical protein
MVKSHVFYAVSEKASLYVHYLGLRSIPFNKHQAGLDDGNLYSGDTRFEFRSDDLL